MQSWLAKHRGGPIGVDLGARSVKLVQFSADRSRLLDAVRWELPPQWRQEESETRRRLVIRALQQAREGRNFRGSAAVLCLNHEQLFVQNLRVPRLDGPNLARQVEEEAAGRLPFPPAEAELRFVEAAEIRQGETPMREVIVMACRRAVLEEYLATIDAAGLRPVSVDVEPAAVLRSFVNQQRREDDARQRAMLIHLGYSRATVLIAEGDHLLFLKQIEAGGQMFDRAVAEKLQLEAGEAAALRRHNGDRRADQQDPLVARGVAEAVRPVFERLCGEISMCMRYHSVTFRGQSIGRVVLSGGEASAAMAQALEQRLNAKCELSDPFRGRQGVELPGRRGQWDVAAGLALRLVA